MRYLGEVLSVLVTVLVSMALAQSVAVQLARSAPNSLQAARTSNHLGVNEERSNPLPAGRTICAGQPVGVRWSSSAFTSPEDKIASQISPASGFRGLDNIARMTTGCLHACPYARTMQAPKQASS